MIYGDQQRQYINITGVPMVQWSACCFWTPGDPSSILSAELRGGGQCELWAKGSSPPTTPIGEDQDPLQRRQSVVPTGAVCAWRTSWGQNIKLTKKLVRLEGHRLWAGQQQRPSSTPFSDNNTSFTTQLWITQDEICPSFVCTVNMWITVYMKIVMEDLPAPSRIKK